MGGQLDRFVVRLVIAITVVSWVGVIGNDLIAADPDESVAPAAASTEAPPEPAAVSVPVNATPPENGAPGLALLMSG